MVRNEPVKGKLMVLSNKLSTSNQQAQAGNWPFSFSRIQIRLTISKPIINQPARSLSDPLHRHSIDLRRLNLPRSTLDPAGLFWSSGAVRSGWKQSTQKRYDCPAKVLFKSSWKIDPIPYVANTSKSSSITVLS